MLPCVKESKPFQRDESVSSFVLLLQKRKSYQYVYKLDSCFPRGWTSHPVSRLPLLHMLPHICIFLMEVVSSHVINRSLLSDILTVFGWCLTVSSDWSVPLHPANQAEWLTDDTMPSIQVLTCPQKKLQCFSFLFVYCSFTHNIVRHLATYLPSQRFHGNSQWLVFS